MTLYYYLYMTAPHFDRCLANYEFSQVSYFYGYNQVLCLLQIKGVVLFIFMLTNHISLIPRL